ncbi:MAG: cation diffusion facilitator family transporter [Bacteroidia bacterium]|nr:cation diffusion facilitator family transporter [Bacteroidia bacterium]MDW8346700.1 cation diffusion facilitator family transporter [Bacteroidia bacterium]
MKVKLLRLSFILAIGLFIVKVSTYFYTHSQMILTDALESIINIVASGFALFSVQWASRPKDSNHPYGHGKIEFFAAGLEGSLIMIAGLSIIVSSAYQLYTGHSHIQGLEVGVGLTLFSTLTNASIGYLLLKQGKKQHSLILQAEAKHILSDTYSSVTVIIGLLIIEITHWTILDSILSILLALYILWSGYRVVRQAILPLLDTADKKIIEEIVHTLKVNREPHWIDIHNLRVIQYGEHIHIDCHVTFPRYWTVEQSEIGQTKIEKLLDKHSPFSTDIFIHVDPCVNEHCRFCNMVACPMRTQSMVSLPEWDVHALTKESNQVNIVS